MKRSISLTLVLILCIIFNNCVKDVRKDKIADNQQEGSSCVSCHKDLGSQLPDDHPVIRTMDPESILRIRKIFDLRHVSRFLDTVHMNKGLTCKDCHGPAMPEIDATIESGKCLGCHGNYEKLAELTENQAYPDKNPHRSHLGEIDCVVCHHAHFPSKSYCIECHHNFVMPMPIRRK